MPALAAPLKNKKRLPTITAEDVSAYAMIVGEHNALTKAREQKGDEIKEALEAGQECPSDGPYLVELMYADVCPHSYKYILETVIKGLTEPHRTVAQKIAQSMLNERVDRVSLSPVKPNPNWGKE